MFHPAANPEFLDGAEAAGVLWIPNLDEDLAVLTANWLAEHPRPDAGPLLLGWLRVAEEPLHAPGDQFVWWCNQHHDPAEDGPPTVERTAARRAAQTHRVVDPCPPATTPHRPPKTHHRTPPQSRRSHLLRCSQESLQTQSRHDRARQQQPRIGHQRPIIEHRLNRVDPTCYAAHRKCLLSWPESLSLSTAFSHVRRPFWWTRQPPPPHRTGGSRFRACAGRRQPMRKEPAIPRQLDVEAHLPARPLRLRWLVRSLLGWSCCWWSGVVFCCTRCRSMRRCLGGPGRGCASGGVI